MPTTDDYGQGVEIAALTDKPDAEKLAKEIANGIAQRSVLRFADAAERNATLTSPVPGMVAYLVAEDLFTGYTAAGWMALAAGGQAWTTVGLVSGFAHNGNSNGSFQYRVVNLFGEPTIMFRGAVSVTYSGTTIPNSGILNASPLPVSARPTTLRTIVVPCSDVNSDRITLKLDLKTNGDLEIFGTGSGSSGTSTPVWIGFNGCFCSL
ncbi:hypothetical protein [Streptomyces chumphonensis]|uniref:hypothetical protein n=1 Tax=Streptomyces chumphonensis TaxID=1214925 RepID=UPI003D74845F